MDFPNTLDKTDINIPTIGEILLRLDIDIIDNKLIVFKPKWDKGIQESNSLVKF